MSVPRALRVMEKDLRLGPRSPIFLWSLALPILLTLVVTLVFGSLLEPPARLAVVDEGSSVLTAELQQTEGIQVTVLDSTEELMAGVEAHDYDAGLVLQEGFDEAVRAGEQPQLQFVVSGQSLASTRAILAVTTLDLIRELSGEPAAVDVVVTQVGDADYVPVEDRMIPLLVIYAVVVAGIFLPAASLVDEREKRTLDAVLITPTRMSEVLLAKLALGVLLAVLMGTVTLLINSAFVQPVGMIVFLVVGAVMLAEAGLMLGLWAKDGNTLFSAIKAGGIIVVMPVIFNLFPTLPQWIAKLFPTYYFLQPIYEMSVAGTALGDHLWQLAVSVGICLALLPGVASLGRRAERRSAMTI